jgi:hypothetical protein
MTVMAPTALRQPFLSALGDMTRGAPWRPRRSGGTSISVGSELVADDGHEGSIWLIAQGEHK